MLWSKYRYVILFGGGVGGGNLIAHAPLAKEQILLSWRYECFVFIMPPEVFADPIDRILLQRYKIVDCINRHAGIPYVFGATVFLWPSITIWRQRSGSTLAQGMVCCLVAPSHYLNQCWLIISKVLWHLSEGIIMRRSEDNQSVKQDWKLHF